MSKKISTLGRVWLVFLIVLGFLGFVSNLASFQKGSVYLVSAIACAGELYAAINLLKGKGINYLYVYGGCYLINSVLSFTSTPDTSAAYLIGFVLGVAINIALTYLSAKNTFHE